jgi:hypothetical protein
MKKLFALLSVVAFLAVNVNAQTTAPAATDTKKEVKSDEKASGASCCMKPNKSCCKNSKEAMKNCTPEQKAACAKSGKECSGHAKAGHEHGAGCDHSKSDASETKEDKSGMK